MCNVIILFLLLCNGCGNSSCGNSSCGNNTCGRDNRCCMTGCGTDNSQGCDSVIQPRKADCGCDRDRDCDCDRDRDCNRDRNCDRDSSMTPPTWVRSNYSNGDTCSCTEQ